MVTSFTPQVTVNHQLLFQWCFPGREALTGGGEEAGQGKGGRNHKGREGKDSDTGVQKHKQVLKVGKLWAIGTSEFLGIFTTHIKKKSHQSVYI